jgi:hypothetical protein
MHSFNLEKSSPKDLGLLCDFHKAAQSKKNRPIAENSPNLVILMHIYPRFSVLLMYFFAASNDYFIKGCNSNFQRKGQSSAIKIWVLKFSRG